MKTTIGAGALVSLLALALAANLSHAADLPSKKDAHEALAAQDPWTGFYLGGTMGYDWGHSNWSGAGASGSLGLARAVDTFAESGSFSAGLQAGYNLLLPNRLLIGAETDMFFAAFPDLRGLAVGGGSNFNSPVLGAAAYSETDEAFGTFRGRIGYAPGDWLFYATGGLAWARTRLTLTQTSSGMTDSPLLWRMGWAAGAGVEVPVAPKWTARLEYLATDFGAKNFNFPGFGQQFHSDFALQSVRLGLNYRLGDDAAENKGALNKGALLDSDRLSLHGQATFVEQAYPAMRGRNEGPNSLPHTGQGRETFDLTLYAGLKLWQDAEFWVNPEIDQGFGVGNAHGAAGFPSGEAYKFGDAFPYARVQRYFVRQTFNLGGEQQKVDADVNIFEAAQTANRLVLTIGKFGIVDIFDTNKYSNNPKTDFLNWTAINAGTFDYAGDAWGYTYGAAAEYYQDRFTVRAGVFDLSNVPAGGVLNETAYGLDPNFSQLQFVGELEERHEIWGQPGKLKVTGFVSHGRAGSFQNAVAVANATGMDPSLALALDRKFRDRTGVSLNLEQQVNENVGVFARAGWADGNIEPWDFTDVDRSLSAGVSISGKQWNRPDDTLGFAGMINGLDKAHEAYFAAGGLGVLVGDGSLPKYSAEKIFETYYNYALTSTVKLGADYQFIADPAYNATRGPANLFAGRVHWTF